MKSLQKSFPTIILALGILILLTLIGRLWNFTVEDSFITFRYSANLAAGYGPTWNPGGEPIEGYTTFLWMLIMTIPHLLQVDAVVSSKILGILLTVAYLFMTYRFTLEVTDFLDKDQRTLLAAMMAFTLCCYVSTAVHAVAGMETALITFLIMAFLYTVTRYIREPTPQLARMLAVFGLLSGLTRPESNLLVFIGLVATYFLVAKAARPAFLRSVGLLFVLPGAAYFAWRFAYYGLMFPLSFYVKVSDHKALMGLAFVLSVIVYFMSTLGILLIISTHKLNKSLIPAILGALSLFVFYLFPDPIMNIEWRFLHPIVPLFFVFGGLGMGVLFDWMNQFKTRSPELVIVSIASLIASIYLTDAPATIRYYNVYSADLERAHVSLGQCLSQYDGGDQSPVIAIGDAGAVPYYSGWQTIDTFGLNDKTIASTNEHDPAYVMSQNPDVVVLLSNELDSFQPGLPWESEYYEASLSAGMGRFAVFKLNEHYYLWVMAVPETPVAEFIADCQKEE